MQSSIDNARRGVYFVASEHNEIKIGYSYDAQQRIAQLQTAQATTLRLLHVQPGRPKLEKRIHKRFRRYHIRGEWFRLTPQILEYIRRQQQCMEKKLMKKCRECSYENQDGLDYCDGCGASLSVALNGSVPIQAPAPRPMLVPSAQQDWMERLIDDSGVTITVRFQNKPTIKTYEYLRDYIAFKLARLTATASDNAYASDSRPPLNA